jgi:hypothetical protein
VIGVTTWVRLSTSNRLFCDLRMLAPKPASPANFEPGELGTLQIGSGVVLSTLGLGFQLGRWPAWAAVLAVGGYLTWVVLYSEVSLQARRHRPSRAEVSEQAAA